MARRQKKYHYIYITWCHITGKFYVGMHSTDDLDDDYMGSGKILGYSRRKYGDENHSTIPFEFYSSREELKAREKEIVDEALLAHPLCINLRYGGDGGNNGSFWNDEHARKFHRAGYEAMNASKDHSAASKKAWDKPSEKMLAHLKTVQAAGNTAARNSAKRKVTMLERGHMQGDKNHNFGKRNACISRGGLRKRIPLEQLDKYLADGWVKGLK